MDQSASIIMAAALLFYSIGVWSERISGRLKPWHLV
ncbi:MAG: TIGR03987 family protein, partial [Anaerolineaceae bacterium]|nr:TIGR03987 family protein [Anaerolineaceae bacterium]